MARLKSKKGCLTCLARKKKCDEEKPICGHCRRLDIACVRRDEAKVGPSTALAITQTNLKARGFSLQNTLSNGYSPFHSDLEKDLTIKSSRVLGPLVSKVSSQRIYGETKLFAQFCATSPLVRHAIIAFQAYNEPDARNESLKSYQKCVMQLQQSRAYEYRDPAEMDYALTAICFLGLLEGLRLGDPRNTIAHFEMCRKLLVARLRHGAITSDLHLTQLYRQVAESVIFNIAYLSPYVPDVLDVAKDWGTAFDGLLPEYDDQASPFLGGFARLYHIMFQIIVLLRRTQNPVHRAASQSTGKTYETLWQQLDKHERSIPFLYRHRPAGDENVKLYRAKYAVSIDALRIQLIKVARPSTTGSDPDIRQYLARSIAMMREQSVVEAYNPALVWPLIVLLCATEDNEDFEFVSEKMQGVAEAQDAANNNRLLSAIATLSRFRQSQGVLENGPGLVPVEDDTCQLDFLLEPMNLVYGGSYRFRSGRVEDIIDNSPEEMTRPAAAIDA